MRTSFYHAGLMAVTSEDSNPHAPAPASNHHAAAPRAAARRELARADVNAELTKLLVHGFGTLTVKIHDHRISLVEVTARLLEGKGEEG